MAAGNELDVQAIYHEALLNKAQLDDGEIPEGLALALEARIEDDGNGNRVVVHQGHIVGRAVRQEVTP